MGRERADYARVSWVMLRYMLRPPKNVAAKNATGWPQLPSNASLMQALTVRMQRLNWRAGRVRGRRKPNPLTRWLTGRERLLMMARLGGLASMARRTPEQRTELARRAALARWHPSR